MVGEEDNGSGTNSLLMRFPENHSIYEGNPLQGLVRGTEGHEVILEFVIKFTNPGD